MIDGALRATAVVTSAIIALSFVLFAAESVSDASRQQQNAVVDPGPTVERQRAAEHTKAREAIDDANDVLLSPLAAFVEGTGSTWVRRGVPALLGLLLYGLGLAYLARLLHVRSRTIVHHPREPAAAPASTKSPPGPA